MEDVVNDIKKLTNKKGNYSLCLWDGDPNNNDFRVEDWYDFSIFNKIDLHLKYRPYRHVKLYDLDGSPEPIYDSFLLSKT